MKVQLSDKKHFYRVTDQTVLALLSQFGGFSFAVLFLLGSVTRGYNRRMFEAELTAQLPIAQKTRLPEVHRRLKNLIERL